MSREVPCRLVLTLSILLAFAFLPRRAHCQKSDSVAVHRKSPTGALLRSASVPGWGQFYNRKYLKAGIFAVGEAWLINGIYTDWRSANRHKSYFESATDPSSKASEFDKYTTVRDRRNLQMWILAVAVFYSMFDAYVDAQLSDFNQTDKAYEVFITPVHDDGIQVVMTFNIR